MAGIGLFGLLDANSKLLSGGFSAAQTIFLRYAVLLGLLFLARGLVRGAGGPLGTRHPGRHLARALSMLGAATFFFLAFRHLPLADGYLIFFTAPFLTLIGAAIYLKEPVPGRAWLWSAVGFSGVLLALSPHLGEGERGSLFGFACALVGTICYTTNVILNRSLRDERGVARLVLWPAIIGGAATLPFAAWHWVEPSALQWTQLIVNGVIAGTGTVMLALAFRVSPPSRLAPFDFVALPWAVALDFAIFGNVPTLPVVAGGAVVAMACVMSERAVSRAARQSQAIPAGNA
ncbi:DMT family transporter [Roseococcus sp. XZZS9]|uniref:DMT family transporter n=2 Tax=Roseococcus pinisoli TaxID=2835040 RepID=A0ABS5Q793_9PROT|nr:DMT family transporter [uncultured Roseococcus sp.]MBS7809496.1 DMT family transporter [Roseococcus pinisoli]